MSAVAIGELKTKFNIRIVWLIGLAVFAQEISWNFYDSQVPVSLGKYIASVDVAFDMLPGKIR